MTHVSLLLKYDHGFVIHGNLRGRLDVKMMLETVEKKNLSGRFICCINMVEIHLRNRGDDSFDGSADCWQFQSH